MTTDIFEGILRCFFDVKFSCINCLMPLFVLWHCEDFENLKSFISVAAKYAAENVDFAVMAVSAPLPVPATETTLT